jgi:ketosteroid isomerase-like protein
MSQENVEAIRRAYEAYNRETTGAVPGTRSVYRGPEGWREFAGWMREEFYDARIEIHELTEAGDQVLAEVTLQGRGKQSGVETRWALWHLWTVQDGKVVRGQALTRRDEALEAAGLSE